jgi:methionyl-tRNA formyltransferase
LPANQISRNIRAFNPFPVAYFELNGERIRVFHAEVEPRTHDAPVGTVLDDNLLVACGQGTAIRLTVLQRAGKKKMNAEDLLKGWQLPKGTSLAV